MIGQRQLPLGWNCKEFENPYQYVVYFISDGEFVKIGFSSGLKSRLAGNQTGNARELRVIRVFECRDENHMKDVEQRFHEMFKPYHVRGEWFCINPYDIPDEIPPKIVGVEYLVQMLLTAQFKIEAQKQLKEFELLNIDLDPYHKIALEMMANASYDEVEEVTLKEGVTTDSFKVAYEEAVQHIDRQPRVTMQAATKGQIRAIAGRAIQACLILG